MTYRNYLNFPHFRLRILWLFLASMLAVALSPWDIAPSIMMLALWAIFLGAQYSNYRDHVNFRPSRIDQVLAVKGLL